MANFYNCHDEEVRVTREQQEANAQLISAAPDLYAILNRALEALQRAEDDYGVPGLYALIEDAYDVLAKARGE